MMIPLGSMLVPEKKSSRMMLILYALALLCIAGGCIFMYLTGNESYTTLVGAYVIGIFLFQWIANAVIIRQEQGDSG